MSLREAIGHYVSVSNSSAGIDFDAVFQPDFPVDAWSEMFKQINLDSSHQKSLTGLITRVLEKPAEERGALVEKLCRPQRRIFIQKGADSELKKYDIARQVVIYILSNSETNLKNMKQALEEINKSSSK
jgi:hypothetical protein